MMIFEINDLFNLMKKDAVEGRKKGVYYFDSLSVSHNENVEVRERIAKAFMFYKNLSFSIVGENILMYGDCDFPTIPESDTKRLRAHIWNYEKTRELYLTETEAKVLELIENGLEFEEDETEYKYKELEKTKKEVLLNYMNIFGKLKGCKVTYRDYESMAYIEFVGEYIKIPNELIYEFFQMFSKVDTISIHPNWNYDEDTKPTEARMIFGFEKEKIVE